MVQKEAGMMVYVFVLFGLLLNCSQVTRVNTQDAAGQWQV